MELKISFREIRKNQFFRMSASFHSSLQKDAIFLENISNRWEKRDVNNVTTDLA